MPHADTLEEFSVSLTEWQRDGAELARLRNVVFVVEHSVPVEIESDEVDLDGLHCRQAVARAADGTAIGTGRLVLEGAIPRISRMAVLREWRGHGVGTGILEVLCREAQRLGYDRVRVHAQTRATAFYYKHGFISHGEEFLEIDVPHQEMRRSLGHRVAPETRGHA